MPTSERKNGRNCPFLEDILRYQYLPGWRHLLDKVTGFFGNKIEIDWGKKPSCPTGWVLSEVGQPNLLLNLIDLNFGFGL